MTDTLRYLKGYGFCLTRDGTKRVLNLDGDGSRTDDKVALLDAFQEIVQERDRLLGEVRSEWAKGIAGIAQEIVRGRIQQILPEAFDRLHQALADYGQHLDPCDTHQGGPYCTCGLQKVLNGKEES